MNQSPGTHLKKRKRKKRHLEQQSGSVSTGSMCAWVCMYSMCVRLFMCTSVCVCVCVYFAVFYSAVDNMSSPSPKSEKVENHAGVCVSQCVSVCPCIYCEKCMCVVKGKAAGFMCVSVFLSFPPLANAYF